MSHNVPFLNMQFERKSFVPSSPVLHGPEGEHQEQGEDKGGFDGGDDDALHVRHHMAEGCNSQDSQANFTSLSRLDHNDFRSGMVTAPAAAGFESVDEISRGALREAGL